MFIPTLRRNRWPVVLPIYDGRRCPDCFAVVIGKHGERGHRAWHEQLEEDLYDSGLGDGGGPDRAGTAVETHEVAPGLLVGGEPYRPERADGSGYFVGGLEEEE